MSAESQALTPTEMDTIFNVTKARTCFPALQQLHQIYFDNAGGSQVLSTVASSVKNYLEETNVQLGASYNVAQQSTESYGKGVEAAAKFMNADVDEIVIGPSTTQLFSNLSLILNLPSDSEIVLSSLDHEANISSWLRLAKVQNLKVKWWKPASTSPNDLMLTPEDLRPLLSEKTKLVACTHTSNVLGTIHDIRAIADEVHKISGARLCVDGVALAPHREVDVKALGADFYSFSWYKVYGPHISILYASHAAQETLGSLGHYFHTGKDLSTKLGLAAASYELVASIPQIVSYFGPDKRKTWEAITVHEEKLQAILLEYLHKREDVTIYGETSSEKKLRVPVVSFTVKGKSSKDIVERIESKSNFGCRWGHFYSKRLVDDLLGLEKCDGVVRKKK
ncbi:hypothetical protein MMC28_011136 [Mycoblastus sanguinarius]|nr:hypothetical protein [Mycoblastus sanguinarius]